MKLVGAESPFDSLRTYSQLPDWLTDEEMLPDHWLLVAGGTHGDERDQIELVRSWQAGPPDGVTPDTLPGVLPVVANKAAADAGVRFIGNQQMMACYPGSFMPPAGDPGNNERRTAAGIHWLTRELSRHHLFIDRHDSAGGCRYAETGTRPTLAAIAAAAIMQHTAFVVADWSRFYNSVPRSLLVEEAVPPAGEPRELYIKQAQHQLETIVGLGYAGLTDLCRTESLLDGMRYYQNVREVLLVNPDTGQPDDRVLSVLPELEDYEASEWGAPIKLSARAIEALDLDPDLNYCVGNAGYDNWSRPVNISGLDDSRQRLLSWGELCTEIRPPQQIHGTEFVTFDLEERYRRWAS
jgi:hypothetical protein